jgi:hypothetical protein
MNETQTPVPVRAFGIPSMKARRTHAGVVIGPQQRWGVGEVIRRLLRLRETISAEAMRNWLESLSHWPSGATPQD